ncbi:MAG: hypothetical protein BWY76_01489 [bacterium ADurb.Bin429]|nr:MAG: hypothetical protein BWY76_01489 [bacterium ADurb.Bin429]
MQGGEGAARHMGDDGEAFGFRAHGIVQYRRRLQHRQRFLVFGGAVRPRLLRDGDHQTLRVIFLQILQDDSAQHVIAGQAFLLSAQVDSIGKCAICEGDHRRQRAHAFGQPVLGDGGGASGVIAGQARVSAGEDFASERHMLAVHHVLDALRPVVCELLAEGFFENLLVNHRFGDFDSIHHQHALFDEEWNSFHPVVGILQPGIVGAGIHAMPTLARQLLQVLRLAKVGFLQFVDTHHEMRFQRGKTLAEEHERGGTAGG